MEETSIVNFCTNLILLMATNFSDINILKCIFHITEVFAFTYCLCNYCMYTYIMHRKLVCA